MRAFLAAVLVSVVLAGASAYILNDMNNEKAYQTFSTAGARVGDPGNNLVGRGWYAPGQGG
jgi:hypothetical protein